MGGSTSGSLGGPNAGGTDAWLAHYGDHWSVVGPGIAGSLGTPVLQGSNTPVPGQPILLSLTGALPNALVLHVVGGSTAHLPLFGGILVPSPDLTLIGFTDGVGALQLYLWIFPVANPAAAVPLTADSNNNQSPEFDATGTWVYYECWLKRTRNIFRVRADGTGTPQAITSAKNGGFYAPSLAP